jgi:hypothetical protein
MGARDWSIGCRWIGHNAGGYIGEPGQPFSDSELPPASPLGAFLLTDEEFLLGS